MNKTESAELLLRLYELRREDKMRDARNWMMTFMPESAEDIMQAIVGTETSAKFRMVTSYWEMAASFVKHGAIDEEMFADANAEHLVIFSKIEPYLEKLREMMGSPKYLKNLETLIMNMPDARQMLAHRREIMKRMAAARAAQNQ